MTCLTYTTQVSRTSCIYFCISLVCPRLCPSICTSDHPATISTLGQLDQRPPFTRPTSQPGRRLIRNIPSTRRFPFNTVHSPCLDTLPHHRHTDDDIPHRLSPDLSLPQSTSTSSTGQNNTPYRTIQYCTITIQTASPIHDSPPPSTRYRDSLIPSRHDDPPSRSPLYPRDHP